MSEIFKEPKKVVKEKKRTYFRILGLVPDEFNSNEIIGYAILDMQGDRRKYQLRIYGVRQAYALVSRYEFDNAITQEGKIVNTESAKSVLLKGVTKDGEEKGYPEFNLKKMMLFNPQGQVIGNPCLVILGGIYEGEISGKPCKYRVIDFKGNVVDFNEHELLEFAESNNLEIQNAKIFNKGTEDATLSSLKGNFPIITKEKVEKIKKEFLGTPEDKKKHLEKLKNKAILATLNTLGKRIESWKDKDINIYIREYAKVEYPEIVKAASNYGNLRSKDIKIKIITACALIDHFMKGNYVTYRYSAGKYWVFSHLIDHDIMDFFLKENYLYNIFMKSGYKELGQMIRIISMENKYFRKAELDFGNVKIIHDKQKKGYYCKPFRKFIKYIIKNAYDNNFKGVENEVLDIYNTIRTPRIKKYIGEMPIIYSLNHRHFDLYLSEADGSNIIKLNMSSNIGIKAIGYTIKKSEEGRTSKDNKLYGPNKPLRYAMADVDEVLSKGELAEIFKRTTCLGDLLITRKLLLVEFENELGPYDSKYSNGEYDYAVGGLNSANDNEILLYKESLMIILAIYNLELAKYLNEKYNLVDLDLDEIGHEDFNLDENDKIYYQTGCKFNRPVIVRNMSWGKEKVSEMPQGLRGAISLNTSMDLDYYVDYILDILYQDLNS